MAKIPARPGARSGTAAAAAGVRRPRFWDDLRHLVVERCFRRRFGEVGGHLCEPGQLPRYGIHRVLVCRPNHRLGNTVLLSPLIAEIEALYPGAEIDLLVGGEAASSLYADRFHVRRIFSLPRKVARHLTFTVGLLRQLRRSQYDLAVDAGYGSQSGRLLLAMTRARFKLGYPDKAAHPQSAWHRMSWPDHHAQRGVFLLRGAYAGPVGQDYPPLNLELSAQEKNDAARIVDALRANAQPRQGRVLGVFCHATGAKCYGNAWWIQFLDVLQLLCPGVTVIELVAEHGRSKLGERFAPYYTRNLRRLAAITGAMDGFIGADCGVMHLAAASGTPTLGLFSVTNPSKYAPYGGLNAAIDTRELDVSRAAIAAARWVSRVMPDAAAEAMRMDEQAILRYVASSVVPASMPPVALMPAGSAA